MELTNKNVFITGSSRGLALALQKHLPKKEPISY